MISSLLCVENNVKHNFRKEINTQDADVNFIQNLKHLLKKYFPQAIYEIITTDLFDTQNPKKGDYELILTHEKGIENYANQEGIDVILWRKLSDLAAQLDEFLQLDRYRERYPVNLKGFKLKEVVHNSHDSVIFRALDARGKTCVIKRFKYQLDEIPSVSVQQYLAILDEQCGLDYPGLVKIYQTGVCDQAFYLVMEFMGHGTLRQSLKSCGKLPLNHALEWFKEITRALGCVHDAGLIHRDLKTENIMLREDGTLALSDYGVSKQILLDSGFVTEEEIHCSPYYVSPEQVSGEVCTQASDIYSLGVIFYELLTGCKPYDADQAFELMIQHVMAPIPQLPHSLKQYQTLINHMLAKDSGERYDQSRQVLEGLSAITL